MDLTDTCRRLTPSQTRRLKNLLQQNPRQAEIEAFVHSCLVEETKSTSTVEKILNSQLRAALSLMPVSTLIKLYGVN